MARKKAKKAPARKAPAKKKVPPARARLERSFAPAPLPPLLETLLVLDEQDGLCGADLTIDGDDGSDLDLQKCRPELTVFGHAGEGSLYGLWAHDGRPAAAAPVVLVSSEGEDQVVANDLTEFAALLASGEPLEPPALWLERPGTDLAELRAALAAHGVTAAKGGERLVARAVAAHPDFEDWLAKRREQASPAEDVLRRMWAKVDAAGVRPGLAAFLPDRVELLEEVDAARWLVTRPDHGVRVGFDPEGGAFSLVSGKKTLADGLSPSALLAELDERLGAGTAAHALAIVLDGYGPKVVARLKASAVKPPARVDTLWRALALPETGAGVLRDVRAAEWVVRRAGAADQRFERFHDAWQAVQPPPPAPSAPAAPVVAPAVEVPADFLGKRLTRVDPDDGSKDYFEVRVDGKVVNTVNGAVGKRERTGQHWADSGKKAIAYAAELYASKLKSGFRPS